MQTRSDDLNNAGSLQRRSQSVICQIVEPVQAEGEREGDRAGDQPHPPRARMSRLYLHRHSLPAVTTWSRIEWPFALTHSDMKINPRWRQTLKRKRIYAWPSHLRPMQTIMQFPRLQSHRHRSLNGCSQPDRSRSKVGVTYTKST